MHGHQVNSFLKQTGALAVSGFTTTVDWEDSTAFDLIYLSAIQENALTRAGMEAVFKKLKQKVGTLYNELGFRYKMLP
jgi:hypothetical protein